MSKFSLKGRVALVTGNSTGLGKAIGLALGQAGAKVPVNYANNDARAEQAVAEYKAAGIETLLVQADVTSEEGVDKLFRETEAKLGKVDIIVPNATCEQPLKPIEEYDWAFYQRMIDFFIKSPFLLTQAGPAAHEAAEVGPHHQHHQRSLSAHRLAVQRVRRGQRWPDRLVAEHRRELAPFGITVNMVAPGWIPVERHENDPQADEGRLRRPDSRRPLGRARRRRRRGASISPANEASFVTGQTLCVNGGMTPW